MTRYFAFLRAINVGGRVVKMDALRALFDGLGFSSVETFIASGNVIFETGASDAARLEKRISTTLGKALGYDVPTFLRTLPELNAIAQLEPFAERNGGSLYVGFLPSKPGASARKAIQQFRTENDEFHVEGREVYWLCRTKMMASIFTGAQLEKAVGMPATMRNINTVQKLVAKYGGKA